MFEGIANFYVTRKNRLEKNCIQDKKIEDIRIVYEEYSIDKIMTILSKLIKSTKSRVK